MWRKTLEMLHQKRTILRRRIYASKLPCGPYLEKVFAGRKLHCWFFEPICGYYRDQLHYTSLLVLGGMNCTTIALTPLSCLELISRCNS